MIIFYNENMEFSKAAAALYLMLNKDFILRQDVPPAKELEENEYAVMPIFNKYITEKSDGEFRYYEVKTLNDIYRRLFDKEPTYPIKMISQYLQGRYDNQFSDKRTIMSFGSQLLYLDVYLIRHYLGMFEEEELLHEYIEDCADAWYLFRDRESSDFSIRKDVTIMGESVLFLNKKPEMYSFPYHTYINANYWVDKGMVYVKMWADREDLNVGLFAKQLGGYGWKNVGYFAMSIEKFEKLIK